MLTPEQAERLSGQRRIVARARTFSPGESEELGLRYAQVGLPFTSEHAAYLTVSLNSADAFTLRALQDLAGTLAASAQKDEYDWVVVVAVSFAQWRHWCRQNAAKFDEALFAGAEGLENLLREHSPPYAYSGGELFFHIKSHQSGRAEQIAREVLQQLGGAIDPARVSLVFGDSMHEGRIYGGRMLHGLIGSVDPVCFSARAIVGDEFPNHKGGCFGVTQQFEHDWSQLSGMADSEMERLIGRDHGGNILLDDDDRCHIKLVRCNTLHFAC
jgi:deferrochelatase/peroxidase EfeB